MRSLSSLSLLAFIAGTLVLVAAARQGKRVRVMTPNPDEFVGFGEECRPKSNGSCSYRLACDCEPKPADYIRETRYFYSPEHKKCFISKLQLGDGCNSFKTLQECSDSCERRRPKIKRVIRKRKTEAEHHSFPYSCNLLQE
uniref:Putative secreted protein n=1 Tax=Amblyomma cajennense TaxID=34607 RepID=A0A023FT33_AMBCJ